MISYLYKDFLSFLLISLGGFISFFLIADIFIENIQFIFGVDKYSSAYKIFLTIYFLLPLLFTVPIFFLKNSRKVFRKHKLMFSIIISLLFLSLTSVIIFIPLFEHIFSLNSFSNINYIIFISILTLIFIALFILSLRQTAKYRGAKESIKFQYILIFISILLFSVLLIYPQLKKPNFNRIKTGQNSLLFADLDILKRLDKTIDKTIDKLEIIKHRNSIINLNNNLLHKSAYFTLSGQNLIDSLYSKLLDTNVHPAELSIFQDISEELIYRAPRGSGVLKMKESNQILLIVEEQLKFIKWKIGKIQKPYINKQYNIFRIYGTGAFLYVILLLLIGLFILEMNFIHENRPNLRTSKRLNHQLVNEKYEEISYVKNYIKLILFLLIPIFIPSIDEFFYSGNSFIPVSPIANIFSNPPDKIEPLGEPLYFIDSSTVNNYPPNLSPNQFMEQVVQIGNDKGYFIKKEKITAIDTNATRIREYIEHFKKNIKPGKNPLLHQSDSDSIANYRPLLIKGTFK